MYECDSKLFSFEHGLEHEFVANGDSCNVICSIRLDGLHDCITLTSIRRIVVLDYVNACEDLNVGLGLLNRLKLKQQKGGCVKNRTKRVQRLFNTYHHCSLVTVSSIKTDPFGQLGHELRQGRMSKSLREIR